MHPDSNRLKFTLIPTLLDNALEDTADLPDAKPESMGKIWPDAISG